VIVWTRQECHPENSIAWAVHRSGFAKFSQIGALALASFRLWMRPSRGGVPIVRSIHLYPNFLATAYDIPEPGRPYDESRMRNEAQCLLPQVLSGAPFPPVTQA
jgi:hypothetical protein